MSEVVLIDAVRTPFGKKRGALSAVHSVALLSTALRAVVDRTGIDPAAVGQVVGGCVSQIGMQAMNISRGAWLSAGLPASVAASTIDAQCGSSQQAVTLAHGLLAGGLVDSAIVCGVESMSHLPIGATVPREGDLGKPITRQYWEHHEPTTQFEAAERLADAWSITREDCDELGKSSQDRAMEAWANGRFDSQIVPVRITGPEPEPTDITLSRDEGLRETSLSALAELSPIGRPHGVHTAGTSSQVSDGASAALLMTRARAVELGLEPMAVLVDSCLVGTDPTLMLTGPISATQTLLGRNQLGIEDIDVFEVNEAFASVVLAWAREMAPDLDRVNPNGGAIALGHPLGATGVALLTKAAHELRRTGGDHALVTMCCGGGLGTGTLLRSA
jgi:acetyl-CoA C-acetyltransferase